MKKSKNRQLTLIATLLSIALIHPSAAAYLDPGTGSMIVQGLIAGIAAVTVTVRLYWYKLVAFFKGVELEDEDDLLGDLDNVPDSEQEEIDKLAK